MKMIFDKAIREDLLQRINSLDHESNARWGKMNITQMVRHCILWDQMALGKLKLKQVFIGYVFGKMALRSILKDERPLQRNMGSLPLLIVSEENEGFEFLKKQWIDSLEEYSKLNENHEFVHSFFGKLNKKQTGILAYKHTDHHLRQFGV